MFKYVGLLSLLLGCRFFGLFVVMPLLTLYVLNLEGGSLFYAGIALGIYALSQMIFQVPFGALSDRFGRKILISIGILIFVIGSIVCAYAPNAHWLIVGRFLQGVGAIGGVVSAMIADIVVEEKRTKAMAIMGGSISLSFTLAIIIGSTMGISGVESVHNLFILSAVLSILSILLLYPIPKIDEVYYQYKIQSGFKEILYNRNLHIISLTNFLQKFCLTLSFILIPTLLQEKFSIQSDGLWKLYVPAALLGVLAMGPSSIFAEKKGFFRAVLGVGVVLFICSYVLMLKTSSEIIFMFGVILFFIGFSLHEPIMQSLASRFIKTYQKGKGLGMFTSIGYLGSFCGGILGSSILSWYQNGYLLEIVCGIGILWLFSLKLMHAPKYLKNLYLPLESHLLQRLHGIENIKGVSEWYINQTEKRVIIRYNTAFINEENLKERLL
ncbi:hypothetical protein CCZ01_04505 [Helicobacter monodelphidis]|uniref:MFS transporter n=1 Tax=Helicobacter sp. 15-1451 TaxID=2004995 RepID=UPI000DCF527E|nr:MFS transporter [Helicobacter sp. 15-1451]RAX57895.1 hypothetical protein CCZ01_04505 [Helicobacter sp. 15-1451]